nr:hypothetical protein [Tanacetum cinerariifolium]
MEKKNSICTLGDYSRPSYEGYRNTIELPDGNNEVPLRSDTIRVDILMKNAISLIGRSESFFGMSSNMLYQLPPKPLRHEAFKDIVMNFILDQEEKFHQLEEYMNAIGREFMQLSLEEFFSSFEFSSVSCRYDLEAKGITFRLEGELRMMSLLEFGWRVGLYSEEQSRLSSTKSGLRRGESVKAEHVLMQFWPTIKDDEFIVGGIAIKKIQDLRVMLAHRCIVTTISGRKKSLIVMGIVMDICGWMCYWPTTHQVREDDDVEEADDEEASGSVEVYQNMSRTDWQVRQAQRMDQHDERRGQLDTWIGRQEEQAK